MARVALGTCRLPQDVLRYSNKRFYDFIESFCGKDEADLLFIQAIRSVDSLLSTEDLYSIFSLDSEDLDTIQKRCGFRNRNDTCTVRPGIRNSLNYITTLLKEKQKEAAKMKKLQLTLIQSTNLSTSSSSIISSSSHTSITSSVLKKTELNIVKSLRIVK